MAKKTMKLATFGKRFAAYLIDIIPVYVIAAMLLISFSIMSLRYYVLDYDYSYSTYTPGGTIAMYAGWISLLAYIGGQLFMYTRAQSIGKAVMGLKVVDSKKGNPVSFWAMLLRECIVKKASSILYLGFIWALIDDYSRTWHDKILDTYVVDERRTRYEVADRTEEYRAAARMRQEQTAVNVPACGPMEAEDELELDNTDIN